MAHFNTSAITETSADFVSGGAPKQFYGLAVVAYIDILGYRSSIQRYWSNSADSPAARLVYLRDHFDGSAERSITLGFKAPGQPNRRCSIRVHTIADAFTISTAIFSDGTKFQTADLMIAFFAVMGNTVSLWNNVLEQGFTIRGAIEFGQVYWDDRTIVGPAQIDAYWLESKLCGESRVLIGPALLNHLLRIQKAGTGPDTFHQIAGSLQIHGDGLVALDELSLQKYLPRVASLSAEAGQHWTKYKGLIARLNSINKRIETGSPESGTTWDQVSSAYDRLQTVIAELKQAESAPSQVGRNEPCPCGSGKKFKNCHGELR